MQPVLDRCFPRFAIVRNVLNQAFRIDAQPLGDGEFFIVQAAFRFRFVPLLFAVYHSITTSVQVKELESFANLQSLSLLPIENNSIDLNRYSQLKKLKSIRYISIRSEQYDCKHIKNCDSLQKANFVGVKLTNTSYLKSLTSLNELILEPVYSDDYLQLKRTLENMPQIKRLKLNNSSIDAKKAMGLFTELNSLEELTLEGEYLLDIESFRNLRKLRKLVLIAPRKNDLTFLNSLPELNELWVVDGDQESLSLPNVKKVRILCEDEYQQL